MHVEGDPLTCEWGNATYFFPHWADALTNELLNPCDMQITNGKLCICAVTFIVNERLLQVLTIINHYHLPSYIVLFPVAGQQTNPTVRLFGKAGVDGMGFVEVQLPNGTWGFVCDDGWNAIAAGIVCAQLCYP